MCSGVTGDGSDEVKGYFSTSPVHFLTKKTIFDPESLRTEFQAAIYQDSVFEFVFIFLILLRVVFCILMVWHLPGKTLAAINLIKISTEISSIAWH